MAKKKMLTTREVAEKLGTDPRTLRRFLRAKDKGVGTGARYEFEPRDIAPLKKSFTSWDKARAEENANTAAPKKGRPRATKVVTDWSLPAVDRAELGMELTDEEQADLARADTEA